MFNGHCTVIMPPAPRPPVSSQSPTVSPSVVCISEAPLATKAPMTISVYLFSSKNDKDGKNFSQALLKVLMNAIYRCKSWHHKTAAIVAASGMTHDRTNGAKRWSRLTKQHLCIQTGCDARLTKTAAVDSEHFVAAPWMSEWIALWSGYTRLSAEQRAITSSSGMASLCPPAI